MPSTSCDSERQSPSWIIEEEGRYQRWTADVHACETVHDVAYSERVMYGWHLNTSQVNEESVVLEQHKPTPTADTSSTKFKALHLTMALSCAAVPILFIALTCYLIGNTAKPLIGILAGLTCTIISYEATIVVLRLMRRS